VYFRKKAETFGILPTIGISGKNQKIKMTQITSRNILPKKKTPFHLLNKNTIHININFSLQAQIQKKRHKALFLTAETYLLPGMLKRLLKRSTRPPVATSRCLPV
jgi:hypothetical protein